jgi:hypothetical protein
MSTESKAPTLAELIARRDNLKLICDSHIPDPSWVVPGDELRSELRCVIGKITTALHEPYEREGARLREKRAALTQELVTAQGQRNVLRSALVHAQGRYSATLADGNDAGEHVATADQLSGELEGVERRIGELTHRCQGVDAQIVELTVAEGAQIVSGVSAA